MERHEEEINKFADWAIHLADANSNYIPPNIGFPGVENNHLKVLAERREENINIIFASMEPYVRPSVIKC